MLIEFTVGNFRSFYQPATLSMLATLLRDDPKLDENNIFQVGKLSLLRSAAIYGPNASGKSNLVRAMMFFRNLVRTSATKLQTGEKIDVERFALNVLSRNSPAYFQIVFLLEGKRYRYGFEVDNASRKPASPSCSERIAKKAPTRISPISSPRLPLISTRRP